MILEVEHLKPNCCFATGSVQLKLLDLGSQELLPYRVIPAPFYKGRPEALVSNGIKPPVVNHVKRVVEGWEKGEIGITIKAIQLVRTKTIPGKDI